VLLVALICGAISASNSSIVGVKGLLNWRLLGAIIALHTTGFGVGYCFAKLFKADEATARTIRLVALLNNNDHDVDDHDDNDEDDHDEYDHDVDDHDDNDDDDDEDE